MPPRGRTTSIGIGHPKTTMSTKPGDRPGQKLTTSPSALQTSSSCPAERSLHCAYSPHSQRLVPCHRSVSPTYAASTQKDNGSSTTGVPSFRPTEDTRPQRDPAKQRPATGVSGHDTQPTKTTSQSGPRCCVTSLVTRTARAAIRSGERERQRSPTGDRPPLPRAPNSARLARVTLADGARDNVRRRGGLALRVRIPAIRRSRSGQPANLRCFELKQCGGLVSAYVFSE